MSATPYGSGSLIIIAQTALRHRHVLLSVYALSLIVFLPTLFYVSAAASKVVLGSGTQQQVDFFYLHLYVLIILLCLQMVALYGGGPVGSLSARSANQLRPLREGTRLGWLLGRSSLVAVLRWMLPYSAFVVLTSAVLGIVGLAFLDTIGLRADFLISLQLIGYIVYKQFPTLTTYFFVVQFIACFIAVLPISITIFTVSMFKSARLKSILKLSVVNLFLSIYGVLLWSIIIGVHVAVFRQERPYYDVFFLFIAGFLFFVTSGATLRLLFIRAWESDVPPLSSFAADHRNVDGSVNLSSSRVFSLMLLAVLYVAVNIAYEQVTKMDRLKNVRQIFAAWYLHDLSEQADRDLSEQVDGSKEKLPSYISNIEIVPKSLLRPEGPQILDAVKVSEVGQQSWVAVPINIRSLKEEKYGTIQGRIVDEQEIKGYLKNSLLAIALNIDVSSDPDESFYKLFGRLHQKLLARRAQVSVPVVGLQVEASNAGWALAGLMLVLLLLMRSRLRRVFIDATLAIEQPWLVLDWHTRMERTAALMWLLLLLIGPWAVNAALVVTLAMQISAEGATSDLRGVALRISLMLGLLLPSAWIAIMTAADLSYLRTLRFQYLTRQYPG